MKTHCRKYEQGKCAIYSTLWKQLHSLLYFRRMMPPFTHSSSEPLCLNLKVKRNLYLYYLKNLKARRKHKMECRRGCFSIKPYVLTPSHSVQPSALQFWVFFSSFPRWHRAVNWIRIYYANTSILYLFTMCEEKNTRRISGVIKIRGALVVTFHETVEMLYKKLLPSAFTTVPTFLPKNLGGSSHLPSRKKPSYFLLWIGTWKNHWQSKVPTNNKHHRVLPYWWRQALMGWRSK